ncbi:hypothetical protein SUBVAR_05406 [Subdoligranulum variabile DSM 15176]|uniref:Uncharacterized protein n=1 Tax=Subdoligranulum variabile DSM 15176 TaxID=411471 RepID=D1PM48_9FIRM|nr:hypothetical protein SUBVAR_05406 [Subdoligranulum variabile DSM 15176]
MKKIAGRERGFPPCFLRKMRKKSQLFAVFWLTSPCHLCILFKQPFEVYYAI